MRAIRGFPVLLGAALFAAGCHFPDTMTAVEHEHEAERDRAESASAEAAVRIADTTRPMPSGSESMSDPGASLAGYAGARVAIDAQSAARHEDAAVRIRRDAAAACMHVPTEQRGSCPIGELLRVEPLPSGTRLVLKTPPAGPTLRSAIDCAIAESHVDRPEGADTCPLYVPGAITNVVERPSGAVIEIIAADDAKVAEVRRRCEAFLHR